MEMMLQSFCPLTFCGFLALYLGSPNPLTPAIAIAANSAIEMSDQAIDHSAEVSRRRRDWGTIRFKSREDDHALIALANSPQLQRRARCRTPLGEAIADEI